jgi:hypothetical protein
MSWKEKMKEFGGGDITFLSADGEVIKFIVVGEPVLLVGEYKGTASRKIACPIICEDGFMIFIAGMRLARKLAKQEEHFNTRVFMAIRHGEEGNPNAVYELKVLDDVDLATKLFNLKQTEFNADIMLEALGAAKKVVEG